MEILSKDLLKLFLTFLPSPIDKIRLSRCNKRYHQYLHQHIEVGKWKYYNLKKRLYEAAKIGDMNLINYLKNKCEVCVDPDRCGNFDNMRTSFCDVHQCAIIKGATKGGHKSIVVDFVKTIKHESLVFVTAARYANKELFNLYFLKREHDGLYMPGTGFNVYLYNAAKGGDKSMVDVALSFGAIDVLGAMEEAASKGHKDMVKYLIEIDKEASKHPGYEGASWKWNWGLYGAARGGYRDLAKLFISKGADNWTCAFTHAARGGHQEFVDFFILKGVCAWNTGLINATKGGHRKLVDFFLSKGANHIGLALKEANKKGHEDLIILFHNIIKKSMKDFI